MMEVTHANRLTHQVREFARILFTALREKCVAADSAIQIV